MALRKLLLPIAAVALCLAVPAIASASIPVYSNALNTTGARSQLVKHEGAECKRGSSKSAFRVELGARTRLCAFSAPVVGRDLEVAVTGRLLSGTPKKVRSRAYLAAALRVGDGGGIVARVFPLQKKMQLILTTPEGETRYLAIAKKEQAIRGLDQANRIFLRAFNQGEPGNCRVVVRVNGRRLAVVDAAHCARLSGRDTVIQAGSLSGGKGLIASFAKLGISVPDPFAG